MSTEREQRELAALERRLAADDPALARRLRTGLPASRPRCDRDVLLLVTLLPLTAAVVLHLPVVSLGEGQQPGEHHV